MSAIGSLSSVSMPLYDRYAESVSPWSAVHGGYSELAADDSFAAEEGDWSGEHACYTDVYVPSNEVDEPLPDRQSMWAMAHGMRGSQAAEAVDGSRVQEALQGVAVQRNEKCFEEAVDCTPSVSGGNVSIVVQRGGAANDVPAATTSLHVTVLGTEVEASMSFPRSAPSIDLQLSGVPSGYQIVKVEALSPSGVLTTMQVMVYVPESADETSHKTPEMPGAIPHETRDWPADDLPARQIRPEDTAPGDRRPVHAVHARRLAESPWHTEDEKHAVAPVPPRAAETILPPPVFAGPPRIYVPDTTPAVRAGEIMAASAAAADVGPVVEHRVRTSGEWALPVSFLMKVRESLGGTLDGRADRRRPPEENRRSLEEPHRAPGVAAGIGGHPPRGGVAVDATWEPRPPTPFDPAAGAGLPQESGPGRLEILQGALDLRAGFHARDDRSLWQESVKSTAVGLMFGGNAAVSPLMLGLGLLLHPRTAAPFR